MRRTRAGPRAEPADYRGAADIARAHGATPGQVAVAWLCQFNPGLVVAIPGASRVEQAVENGGTLELTLARPELEKLDELSSQGTRR